MRIIPGAFVPGLQLVPLLGALVALLVAACGGKVEAPAEKTYTLYYNAQKDPQGGVPAKLTVPAAWKAGASAASALADVPRRGPSSTAKTTSRMTGAPLAAGSASRVVTGTISAAK